MKNRPYEITKEKHGMVDAMLDGDLLESWKLWHQTESDKEIEGTFQKRDSGETYKKKFKKGDSDGVFRYCLGKVYNRFIKKYNARKKKAYMRAGLIKLKYFSVDAM